MSSPSAEFSEKKQAALAYALGRTRSVLSDILDGDISRDQIQRIYDATASDRIAESIGLSSEELSVDWRDLLSEKEKHKIQGYE